MKSIYSKIFLVIISICVLLLSAAMVHAYTADGPEISSQGEVNLQLNSAPIKPEDDTCIQCHVDENFTNIWTPIARWVLFGAAGIVFLFGFARSASIWKSREAWVPIPKRISLYLDDRFQLSDFLKPIISKPVPDWQRRWWYCLGGLTFFLFIVQGITGIMLAFYYKPTPAEAYASIQFIENEVLLGSAVRMIHHWSSNGMIALACAHMLRVFIMGAYKPPRELNWISGVALLVMTLGLSLIHI